MLDFIGFQYFFDAYPPRIQDSTFWFLLVSSLILLMIGIGIKFLKKKIFFKLSLDKYQRILLAKLADIFLSASIINLLLVYLRKVQTPYLQMRFILFLWWVIIIIWLISVMQYHLLKVPELREQDRKRREYEKYLK